MSQAQPIGGSVSPVVNIAAYKFVSLDKLALRRQGLKTLCGKLGLKGTILLSPEGINLFVAGSRAGVERLLANLRSETIFADLVVKESLSDALPFSRMLVHLKKEIIACGADDIDPRTRTSPSISPIELKQWLDEGRKMILLDTRNDYEVQLGTFNGATHLNISHFREFSRAANRLPKPAGSEPIVMFCTGGIRCEKAGPLLEQQGFGNVYQLDGGILKYFDDCGGDHWNGECFVFDQRVAVDPDLRETDTQQCFACQALLSAADQASEKYVLGKSCPHCFQDPRRRMLQAIEYRQQQLALATNPLPGSRPYDNQRPLNVPGRFDRHSLLDCLDSFHPHVGRPQWQRTIEAGRVLHQDRPAAADTIVRAGQRYVHLLPATVEPAVNAAVAIFYEDDSLVVVNKPAPLPMHPCGRFNRNSLVWILNRIYQPERLRAAHRLDANTTGVVVFSRTRAIARLVQQQFERRTVHKTYIARVHGAPEQEAFVCETPISDQPEAAGIRLPCPDGLHARTEFRLVEHLSDGTSLVEARPITGRTNQIRLHLWDLGLPICGDPAYLPDRRIGRLQTLSVNDDPLCLHAARIELQHPSDDSVISFEAPLPEWTHSVSSIDSRSL